MKAGMAPRGPVLRPCSLSGFTYQLDPYIGCEYRCHYCYTLNQTGTNWKNGILIHPDLVEELDRELSSLAPQKIYMGWNTDPYQPAERGRRQTRQALELLLRRGFSACVLTKSDLITRDIDLFRQMPDSSVGVSIAFQDEETRRYFEPKAPPNKRRLTALKALKEAGIRTYLLICPVMPFITNVEALIQQVAPVADTIWIYPLQFKEREDRNWQLVEEILCRHFPDLKESYGEIAFSTAHPYWAELRRKLHSLKEKLGMDLRIEL